ncbi:hypothetical protein DXG03_002042 [Asterophora parasitica]|uniref:Uncharacterized protein n=1 Tax=Asterophora parasitica TaxID=117018 RepID=A0A9P7FWN8_9AGAR|nr:hypothetical protein DXG03_002042 [Asterophora parasitica]
MDPDIHKRVDVPDLPKLSIQLHHQVMKDSIFEILDGVHFEKFHARKFQLLGSPRHRRHDFRKMFVKSLGQAVAEALDRVRLELANDHGPADLVCQGLLGIIDGSHLVNMVPQPRRPR